MNRNLLSCTWALLWLWLSGEACGPHLLPPVCSDPPARSAPHPAVMPAPRGDVTARTTTRTWCWRSERTGRVHERSINKSGRTDGRIQRRRGQSDHSYCVDSCEKQLGDVAVDRLHWQPGPRQEVGEITTLHLLSTGNLLCFGRQTLVNVAFRWKHRDERPLWQDIETKQEVVSFSKVCK